MTNSPMARGQVLASPYPSVMHDLAEASFNSLDYHSQLAVDDALSALEWTPVPEDAREVKDDGVVYYAVSTGSIWIIYEVDATQEQIYVWRVSVRRAI